MRWVSEVSNGELIIQLLYKGKGMRGGGGGGGNDRNKDPLWYSGDTQLKSIFNTHIYIFNRRQHTHTF